MLFFLRSLELYRMSEADGQNISNNGSVHFRHQEESNRSLKLTLLSHLLIFLSGNESSPGLLNDSGKSVKFSFPHLLQEEKLWGQIKLCFKLREIV